MARTARPRWTPPRVRSILLFLAAIFVLNAFDVWATLVVVRVAGTGEEMNPLMRRALEAGPLTFIAVKMGMIAFFASGLGWLARRRRMAWNGLRGIAVLYAMLVAYQIAVFIAVPPPTLDPFSPAAPAAALFYKSILTACGSRARPAGKPESERGLGHRPSRWTLRHPQTDPSHHRTPCPTNRSRRCGTPFSRQISSYT